MEIGFIKKIIKCIEEASHNHDFDYFCVSRDIFQARLDSFIVHTNKYFESAVIGEIGNNTFDHNWDFAEDEMRGTYFNSEYDGYVVLADFGKGIKNSLSRVRLLDSDLDAVKMAFTERVSGRAPEQRGNGLKFVCDSVKDKKWELYFQSGNGCCIIKDGNIRFETVDFSFAGCLAVLKF